MNTIYDMCNILPRILTKIKFIILFISISFESMAQLHLGLKAGFQAFTPIYKDAVMYKDISSNPKVGYNVGLALDYKANNNFSFYTELLYSRKGKRLSGGINDKFENNAVYHYLEIPVLMRITLHENIRGKTFTWFINGGGTFNYWLSGHGYIKSFELNESAVDKVDYFIKFKPKPANAIDERFVIYLNEPNRIQVGLVIGTGILIDLAPEKQLAIDLRYTLRQSWLARDKNVDVGLGEYYEDFRTREHSLSLNVAYLFEYNLGQNKKGKNSKRTIIKTKRVGGPPAPPKQNINKIMKSK